ncbi:MAG TPA: TIGR03435 family protein [Bryobacteraceae bacterium]|nr:TIGR03435 family protein [Bryobacteraceae bacterium]
MSLVRFAVWCCLGASAAFSQPQAFEVATVKPAAPDDTVSGLQPSTTPGRMEFRNATLRLLIYWAYGTGMSTAMKVSGGPDWINRNRYTVEATAAGNPTDRDYRAMLRSLLEERFGLKTHMETRQIEVFALEPNRKDEKLGPKVKPWTGSCANGQQPRTGDDPTMPRCTAAFRPPGLVLEGVSMTPVAEMLSTQRRLLGMIVQDRTGLAGPYNIELEFDFPAANQPPYTGPSIFTALKQQLGLKLEPSKGPLQVLMVDSAELPGEN